MVDAGNGNPPPSGSRTCGRGTRSKSTDPSRSRTHGGGGIPALAADSHPVGPRPKPKPRTHHHRPLAAGRDREPSTSTSTSAATVRFAGDGASDRPRSRSTSRTTSSRSAAAAAAADRSRRQDEFVPAPVAPRPKAGGRLVAPRAASLGPSSAAATATNTAMDFRPVASSLGPSAATNWYLQHQPIRPRPLAASVDPPATTNRQPAEPRPRTRTDRQFNSSGAVPRSSVGSRRGPRASNRPPTCGPKKSRGAEPRPQPRERARVIPTLAVNSQSANKLQSQSRPRPKKVGGDRPLASSIDSSATSRTSGEVLSDIISDDELDDDGAEGEQAQRRLVYPYSAAAPSYPPNIPEETPERPASLLRRCKAQRKKRAPDAPHGPYSGAIAERARNLARADAAAPSRPPRAEGGDAAADGASLLERCKAQCKKRAPKLRFQRSDSQREELLCQIFPKHVVDALVQGRTVDADRADLATMFFSDIVGFTDVAAALTPDQVSDLLDRLYLKFDALSRKHDVFKIETIGDAYVGVCNLVKEQEYDHAKRVVEFAIDVMEAAGETPILPSDSGMGRVRLRVGVHCGPLVARVVGSLNPRYCVFGDTVNVTARMEGNSLPMRIHCSEAAAEVLRWQVPELKLIPRGAIPIKGKGEMKTYFVNHDEYVMSLR
ncbi:hypothetical protein ACHAWF_006271 [Thalassiosira exigua]